MEHYFLTKQRLNLTNYENKTPNDYLRYRSFLQIIDCCKYLAQQSGDCESRGLACILTPYKVASVDISIRVKQAISSAQQDGNKNNITSIVLKSSGTPPSSEAQQNQIVNNFQEPGTCRSRYQFEGPSPTF